MRNFEITNIPNKDTALEPKLVKVKDLLQNQRLNIPYYQRPYKWETHHVGQLLEDIERFKHLSAYRLGTLVVHNNERIDTFDIVDGQQRTLSLTLIIRAYIEINGATENEELDNLFKELEKSLFNPILKHPISQKNIQENYKYICQRIRKLDEASILFLLNKCEFVQFTLQDLDTAFQFFDSQNSRGKDLDPHDLLKAFHLRSFEEGDYSQIEALTDKWENTDPKELSDLFSYYLFRIKNWSKHHSARRFTKSHTDLFKGLNPKDQHKWPYTKILLMADVYTKAYMQSPDRRLDRVHLDFPFQLELPIINGRLFFEMINHYLKLKQELWEKIKASDIKEETKRILEIINDYKGQHRRGDRYIRELFDATLLQYVDKFGLDQIDELIKHLFIWCYKLRFEKQRIQLATMDNYAMESNSYLIAIKNALYPSEVLSKAYPMSIDLKYLNTEKLQEEFKRILGENIFSNDSK